MKKIENFCNALSVLRKADFDKASDDEIYRTGIIGQFNLTFELAWKALQAVMQSHSVQGAESGSPREIIKLGYKISFVQQEEEWLLMLKKRNLSVHIYDEEEIDEMIELIRDVFISAFEVLADCLQKKADEVEMGMKADFDRTKKHE